MTNPERGKEEVHVPGTLALVFIFLAWFAFFYALGWWSLAQLWPVR